MHATANCKLKFSNNPSVTIIRQYATQTEQQFYDILAGAFGVASAKKQPLSNAQMLCLTGILCFSKEVTFKHGRKHAVKRIYRGLGMCRHCGMFRQTDISCLSINQLNADSTCRVDFMQMIQITHYKQRTCTVYIG